MSKRGFTLVEVLISILIITIGVGGAFLIYRTGTESYLKVREHNLISGFSLFFILGGIYGSFF